jgi:hypothetical protein
MREAGGIVPPASPVMLTAVHDVNVPYSILNTSRWPLSIRSMYPAIAARPHASFSHCCAARSKQYKPQPLAHHRK